MEGPAEGGPAEGGPGEGHPGEGDQGEGRGVPFGVVLGGGGTVGVGAARVARLGLKILHFGAEQVHRKVGLAKLGLGRSSLGQTWVLARVGHSPGNVQVPDVPDRRLMRVRAAMRRDSRSEVRRAAEVVRSLAERVGQVDLVAGVPRAIRRHQWPAFNIPLMWAAAVGDRSCPVLQWLAQSAQHLSVMAGWEALHQALNVVGIQSVEGLSEWVFMTGVPTTTMGCPCVRACARTTHEQRNPHQRQGHFS